MKFNHSLTFILLASIIVIFTAAQMGPKPTFRNLKVLPQDITQNRLDSIMHEYNKALKVNCDFCHIPAKDFTGLNIGSNQLDFALDNSMKENARKMMIMTININKTNFYYDSTIKAEYLNVVNCNTCHRGNPYPAH
ncbi:MAG: hypothetical protein RLY16_299 [Bacteroidota bacterium]|jgi:hypothetical protein